MKFFKLLSVVLFSLMSGTLVAQMVSLTTSGLIRTLYISVAANKTTNLLFPYSIKSVDRGSSDILAQKAPGTENVLQVKAAKPGFEQTNLSVITADGELYSFLVDYGKNPLTLNYNFDNSGKQITAEVSADPVQFTDSSLNEKQLHLLTEKVSGLGNNVHGLKDRSFKIKYKITGIYVKGDRMFFRILLKNKSDIDYDIDQFRFFIRDQKRVKRTASQETEINSVYSIARPNIIKGRTRQVCVIVLPKFTIPDKKYFTAEMTEKNGGRFLRVDINNSDLMNSESL